MLNAAALEFLTLVDELLFEPTAPANVKQVFHHLHDLKVLRVCMGNQLYLGTNSHIVR